MSTILITTPLPRSRFTPENKGPRIVVMVTASSIRMQRCTASDQAQMVAKQWRHNDFSNWPGVVRPVGGG